MTYELMLLGDRAVERSHVLALLNSEPDIRPDPDLTSRFWLSLASDATAQINIGTKDTVESIHVEAELTAEEQLVSLARRCLAWSHELDFRLEDVLWGREVTDANLEGVRQQWNKFSAHHAAVKASTKKPWWRRW